jgi:HAD superfamily hydrolase (TIGR01509 family)
MNKQPSRHAGVLFDIDGTLIDSNYLHALAWWRALKDSGHRVPMYRIHRLIGMGSDKLLQELLGEYSEDVSEIYSEYFRPLREQVVRFEGVHDLLREVHSRGVMVVLATSAKKEDLDVFMKVLDADDAIDHVTSSADVDESKPSPDVFETALKATGLPKDNVVAVGDTVWDVKAAGELGIECICVETGGIARQELEEAGAVAVFRDVRELLDNLEAGPTGKLFGGTRVR